MGDEKETVQRSEPKESETKKCERCSQWKKVRKQIRLSELLSSAVEKLQKKIKEDDFKPSIADYLKLVDAEEDLEQASEGAKEIKVTWVEPAASASEK